MFDSQKVKGTPVTSATDATIKDQMIGRANTAKDNLIDNGKGALQLGLDLAGGQAALAILRSFVVPAKVSLVDKVTGKGAFIKKVANSAYGSLAIAATAQVLVSIVAPKNAKPQKVCDLALKAAAAEAVAKIPMQDYADKLAKKMFNNPVIAKVLGDSDVKKTQD